MDGELGGNERNDWVLGYEVRYELTSKIDDTGAYLATFLLQGKGGGSPPPILFSHPKDHEKLAFKRSISILACPRTSGLDVLDGGFVDPLHLASARI